MLNFKKNTVVTSTLLAVALTLGTAQAAEYKASDKEGPIKIVNLDELESQVAKNMEKGAFGYIRGGAEDELNLNKNTQHFDKKYIMPRVMQGIEISDIDLSTDFLGIKLKTPIIQAPMAAQGLAHKEGEIATAKGMAKAGSIFSLSTYGNKTIEEVAEVSGNNPFFFQLYMSKNEAFNEFTLKRAKESGAKAIILTVDSPVGGYREDDIRNNFQFPLGFANLELFAQQNSDGSKTGKGAGISEIYAQAKQAFTPADIQYVKKLSGLPVIVKGIQSPEDADVVIKAGADAIWVSNHGGRQLDSGPASFDVLPSIAKVVNKRVPIVFDSGVRRGSHVFKALASGADVVAVGRPILYGLNLGGAEGVNSVIQQLNKELSINMMLGGAKNIEGVKATQLYTDKDFQ
ncbi:MULTISPECIES: lactate oxidase [Providencia]|uniref:Lactate oxidase n=1 Tax=Providencia huaxiensis TaxID=2027290 RepID=A0ABU2IS26_9GAMM|nr:MULTISPECIES: lactate oxidase [Providencia]AXH63355.1 lactate oxidase [Providencia huaxiensis]MBN6360698.1 alpha-hydroxy-acid oxidizing protein [Providencia huaxiensis]MBQ0535189.1 alpha-hydroxy-acid oxidizing protein [Providencia huaxiensis]MBQ0589988.1 alpha-hydroxy-acid oxidizing protein [Providencia huaxiensis]MBZ3680796.1 alpha-hydroxy-acid oxidizing protein [Providencia rettgeri]